jgi:hypothetical protein
MHHLIGGGGTCKQVEQTIKMFCLLHTLFLIVPQNIKCCFLVSYLFVYIIGRILSCPIGTIIRAGLVQ